MLTRLPLLALALAGLMLWAGCISQPGENRAPFGGLGVGGLYYGPDTLEERILRSDAIVRARLLSATPATERTDPTDYIGVVELRFKVLEYLRGGGAGELVALIERDGVFYGSSGKALDAARALRDNRDTQWDNREAILFLRNVEEWLPSTKQADRYWLGSANYGYTVASGDSKRWLPAVAGDGAASGSDGQRFLLDASTPPATITLAGMKARIAALDQEIAAGVAGFGDAIMSGGSSSSSQGAGGLSAAYRECLYLKHERARRVSYLKEHGGPFKAGRDYYYIRHDSAIGSGLPAGTRAFTDPLKGEGETAPPGAGDFPIMDGDAELFTTAWPGVADTVRPLPAGEYRFHYSYRPREYIICDGQPEAEKKREEVFVTVAAPAGTVHEAFFDPLSGASGVPVPPEFSVGGVSTSAQRLQWRNGAVSLRLSRYADLAGHALDLIALDGTVALSLDAGSATVDRAAKTLTWAVTPQPWRAGDRLMLRIRRSSVTATPVPTATPSTPEVSVSGGSGVTEGGAATFTITASPAPSSSLDVSVSVSQSGDYGVTTGTRTVTIATSGSGTLTVPTADDSADEADGSVTATVKAGSGYTVSASKGAASVAVADDDAASKPEVSITGGGGVTEGGDATFTLTASPSPTAQFDVTVAVSQSGDFGVTTGTRTVTIATSGSGTLTVSTADDSADEADGSVTATVKAGSGYTVSSGNGTASVSVADNDDPAPQDLPEVSIADASVVEGGILRIPLTLNQASEQDITVHYEIRMDRYTFRERLRIPAGRTQVTTSITVTDDSRRDGDKTMVVEITRADGAVIANGTATVTIIDDD